ncbi:MAG: thioredoxin-disulfide reductase [Verrucomicrobia bacterium]|nr:thioredoxin-disulfide reductase [Verrucomicrobiota bacterium]
MQKVIIIGTGCAGLTAAIYTARANLSPLVLEGREPGGQLTSTTLVENFPGFPDGIDGPQLIMNMHRQAEKFGAEFKYAEVQGFEPVDGRYRLQMDGESIETQSVIIASGASAKWLGLEHECKFKGHGVTSCATCDGAFYRNVPVCVIGGGDTATEEAIFLTRFASQVFLIHRRDSLRASKIMAERALNHPKVQPIWNTEVSRYLGDKKGEIAGVELRNVETGKLSTLDVKCVFVAIGHTPNTAPFKGKVEMDANGYLVRKKGTKTNLPGVFAAGDVADPIYRQAVTAAGQGCAAAIEAERYLTDLE